MKSGAKHIGRRARCLGEKCAWCDDPGIGMVIRIPAKDIYTSRQGEDHVISEDTQLICSRCARKGAR